MEIFKTTLIISTLLLISPHPSFQQIHDDVEMIFVGLADSKSYFTANILGHFIGSMDLCHVKGMVPGSIESQQENDIVTKFLMNTNNLSDPRVFWLTATDHDEESKYKWISTKEEVDYSNFGYDYPTMNTSVNCLTVNAIGHWIETECNENITFYPLCEMRTYNTQTFLPNPSQSMKEQKKENKDALSKLKILMADETIITIGPVGNKYFFAENATILEAEENHFFEVMDVCHSMGLHLAEPETEEEHTFLTNFALQNFISSPQRPFLYTVAVTDMLSYNCFSSNAFFRGFYSGEIFTPKNLIGNWYRYKCGYLTPGGIETRDCDGPWSPFLCQLIVD